MKRALFVGSLLIIFLGYTIPGYAQDINQGMNSGSTKTVSEARSISLINTVLSIGAGITSVAAFDNPTVKKVGAYTTIYGILMGPSTGHFYAEDYPRGAVGIGARAIGSILMVDATREVFGNEYGDVLNVDNKEVSLTDTKMLIGEAFLLAGLVYNMISLKSSVDEYNAAHQNMTVNVTSEHVNNTVAPVLTARFNF